MRSSSILDRLEKAISAASALLEVPARDLDIEEGMVIQPGKNLSISLREIADSLAGVRGYKIATGLAPGLEAAVNFEISELTHGLGVHPVELTVDPYTGTVSLLRREGLRPER